MRVLVPLYTTVCVSCTTVHVAGRGTDILLGATPATCVCSYCCILLFMCPVYSCICVLHCTLLCMWPAEALMSFSALHLLHVCPRATVYYCMCVLMLLCMCPHTSACVSSYYCVCVLMLLCVCPHATLYVSSCCYMCPHTTIHVSSSNYIRVLPAYEALSLFTKKRMRACVV
jgi:hypothetical protein